MSGSGAGPVLDVVGLRVAFPGGGAARGGGTVRRGDREVLRGIDLRVEAGECVAVVGGSGAGKSVLARALVGLAGESGRARVHADRHDLLGRDVRTLGERGWRAVRGRDVGLVLQDALQSLDPLRTVGAEVGEALAVRRCPVPSGTPGWSPRWPTPGCPIPRCTPGSGPARCPAACASAR
jgi:peptide/nickel transport system ATP-binding protein